MARMVFSEVVGTMSFLRPQCDDDSVDRLHYYYTPTFLLVVAVLISLKMFGGSPIECWLPAEFRPSWQEYTELVCWSMSTYFIPQFNSIRKDNTSPLDGVGIFGGSSSSSTSDPTHHALLAYYQWTPFFLILSAVLFYSPCVVWRKLSAKSGLVLSEIVAFAMAIDRCPNLQNMQMRNAKLRGIALHLSSAFRQRLKWHRITKAKGIHWLFEEGIIRYHGAYLAMLYLFIKVLFLLIVFLQACLMNRFLQTDDYDFYGWGVFQDLLQGKAWSDSGNFPRITFCDIDVRILGTVQRYTVQCILVINIFTEKVFILLWLWYSLLLLIGLFNVFGWLFSIFPLSSRREFIVHRLQMADINFAKDEANERRIDEFVRNFLKIDGCFVLRMVDMHSVEWICAEIVDAIWEDFVRDKTTADEGLTHEIKSGEEQLLPRRRKKGMLKLKPLLLDRAELFNWSSMPNLGIPSPVAVPPKPAPIIHHFLDRSDQSFGKIMKWTQRSSKDANLYNRKLSPLAREGYSALREEYQREEKMEKKGQ